MRPVVSDAAIESYRKHAANEYCFVFHLDVTLKLRLRSRVNLFADVTRGNHRLWRSRPEHIFTAVRPIQQIMGALTKRVFPRAWQLPSSTSGADSMEVCNGDAASSPSAPQGVFHVAIAQCYDKKLEASRKDFRHEDLGGQTEVDIVLTTTELMGLIEERAMAHDAVSGGSPSAKLSSGASRAPSEAGLGSSGGAAADVAGAFFRSYPASDITQPLGPGFPVGQASVSADGLSLFGGISGEGSAGGNSGGYLEYVFRYAAYRLFGRDLMGQPLVYREGRNSDFRETSLEVRMLSVLGELFWGIVRGCVDWFAQ